MPRPFFPLSLFAAFITALPLTAAPAVPLTNLVDDQALAVISIGDTPALLKGWDRTALARTWADPQFVKFLAPARAKMKVDAWDEQTEAATGLTVRELFALAEGEALLAVPSFDPAKREHKSPVPFLLAVQVGDHGPKLESLLADAAKKNSATEETETFSGATVHLIAREKKTADETAASTEVARAPLAWALVDGTWLVSTDKEQVFAAIDALKQGGVGSALGKSERFLRTRQRTGDAQALFYVNTPAVYPLVRDAVTAAKDKMPPNPMGVDATTLFGAMGMDALGETYGALHIDEKDTRVDFGLAYTDARGLLKLLAYQPGPVPQPEWIPAKWPTVSTARFSFIQAYAGVEELLESVSPMLSGLVQGQIRAYNRKLGIDLKRDLIGSLGEEFVSANVQPAGTAAGGTAGFHELEQLFAVSLSNEATFTKSIEALKRLAGPAADKLFTKREYLGFTLYSLNTPPPAPGAKPVKGFSYAIANRTFLLGIGSAAPVESALQGMTAGRNEFWNRDEIKAALATIPSDASSFQVQDTQALVNSFIEMVVQLQPAAKDGDDSKADTEKKIWVDVSARPDAETVARYWGLASGYSVKTSEGLFSSSHIANPQP